VETPIVETALFIDLTFELREPPSGLVLRVKI